jgi:hypothetical protein
MDTHGSHGSHGAQSTDAAKDGALPAPARVTETKSNIDKEAMSRMEQSILQGKLATKTCGHCGSLGRWKIAHTQGATRYLKCEGCGIGGEHCQVIVTRGEVEEALFSKKASPGTATPARPLSQKAMPQPATADKKSPASGPS